MQNITKSELIFLIGEGMSTYQIADVFERGQSTIRYWLTLYDLKTNPNQSRSRSVSCRRASSKVPIEMARDWTKIQAYYDLGKYWNDCIANKELKVNSVLISAARKAGVVKSRNDLLTFSMKNMGNKHTPETKQKLSDARKVYLTRENKPAWKIHDKFKSQPCEWLKKELESRGYKFVPELSPLKDQGRFYSVDIAFPEQKFIIEINGRQHYNPDGTLTQYYQTRNELIERDGWKIWEVPYSSTRNIGFLDLVLGTLKSKNIHPITT